MTLLLLGSSEKSVIVICFSVICAVSLYSWSSKYCPAGRKTFLSYRQSYFFQSVSVVSEFKFLRCTSRLSNVSARSSRTKLGKAL